MKLNLNTLKKVYKINFKKLNTVYRYYSTSTTPNKNLAIPVLTMSNLQDKKFVSSKCILLRNKSGIYSFVNKMNGNQYIGSAKDIYLRLKEHLSNRKSNWALQYAINKYKLANFYFCIYEYFTYIDKATNNKLLTDLETSYIKNF